MDEQVGANHSKKGQNGDRARDGTGRASTMSPPSTENGADENRWTRGRLVWRDDVPREPGEWCVRYVFAGGSYSWWTVTVTNTDEGFYVLGPTANGSSAPVAVETYPDVEKMGKTQWAGPIQEPWDEKGFSMRHCDGCGKVWTPGAEMLVQSRLVCCARCWERVPKGLRTAFVGVPNPDGRPSPEEEALRAYIIASRRQDRL